MHDVRFSREKCPIAAFDLDGTLVPDFSLIPSDRAVKTLKDLMDSGIKVVLASGRDYSQIDRRMLECFSYAVLTNGSCILDLSCGDLIWSRRIEWLRLYKAVKKIESFRGSAFLMQNGVIRGTEEGEKLVVSTMLKNNGNDTIIGGYSGTGTRYRRVIEAVNPFAEPTYKVQAFFRDGDDCSSAYEELRKDKELSVLIMFGTTIEITAAGVSKAAALNMLCERFGYPPGSYAAFGDSRNDIEMLRASAYAVVMENGEQCAKDIADHIAPPVSEDGAAMAVSELYGI